MFVLFDYTGKIPRLVNKYFLTHSAADAFVQRQSTNDPNSFLDYEIHELTEGRPHSQRTKDLEPSIYRIC